MAPRRESPFLQAFPVTSLAIPTVSSTAPFWSLEERPGVFKIAKPEENIDIRYNVRKSTSYNDLPSKGWALRVIEKRIGPNAM